MNRFIGRNTEKIRNRFTRRQICLCRKVLFTEKDVNDLHILFS